MVRLGLRVREGVKFSTSCEGGGRDTRHGKAWHGELGLGIDTGREPLASRTSGDGHTPSGAKESPSVGSCQGISPGDTKALVLCPLTARGVQQEGTKMLSSNSTLR